ncbi:MAG: hypothetical protein HOE53_01890 [Candidatus Magasanikbacteria bacterium]|nr:hypothetical protein [Candidatus Magasanikbacteria bacterium]
MARILLATITALFLAACGDLPNPALDEADADFVIVQVTWDADGHFTRLDEPGAEWEQISLDERVPTTEVRNYQIEGICKLGDQIAYYEQTFDLQGPHRLGEDPLKLSMGIVFSGQRFAELDGCDFRLTGYTQDESPVYPLNRTGLAEISEEGTVERIAGTAVNLTGTLSVAVGGEVRNVWDVTAERWPAWVWQLSR